LRAVERESFIKGFALYFLSMSLSVGTLFLIDHRQAVTALEKEIASQMKLCSYNLQCQGYDLSFVPLKTQNLNLLKKGADGSVYSDFSIPQSKNYAMRITLPQSRYTQLKRQITRRYLWRFGLSEIIIALLSALFAWYALRPLRDALRLTEEFVKDILHDFNTPLSTIRLNAALLKKRLPQAGEIGRIEQAVQTVLDLQNNLKAYLEKSANRATRADLAELVRLRLETLGGNHPDITYRMDIPPATLHTDIKAFGRILDNLLNNAFVHNRPGGSVTVRFDPRSAILRIEDTGRGIQNPGRVFERFYKESSKGNGLGMHIVKKLCDALKIPISIQSRPGHGTVVELNIADILTSTSRR